MKTEQQLRDAGYHPNPDGSWSKGFVDGTLRFPKATVATPPKPPKRIRQSSKPLMNKLEQEWHGILSDRPGYVVLAQSIRFMLGNGIWYKPDFVVLGEAGIMAYEVKGPHAFRGGFENLKVAAHIYQRNIWWWLVWKDDRDHWQEQRILP